jgi:hypothetical protein
VGKNVALWCPERNARVLSRDDVVILVPRFSRSLPLHDCSSSSCYSFRPLKDLEVFVIQHQLAVLGRHVDRLATNNDDRTLPGVIAAPLPRQL